VTRDDPAQAELATWELWIGAGLAAGAKGLWGLLVLALALLARAFLRPGAARLARAPAVLAGSCLAALGIAPLFFSGASAAAEDAAGDQLRAADGFADVLHNAREYLPAPLIHFLPWTLLLAAGLFSRQGRASVRRILSLPVSRTALTWWCLLVAVFLLGAQRRVRYLAPADAPLAVVLATALFALAAEESSARRLKRAGVFLCGLATTLLLAGAVFTLPESVLAGCALLVLGGTGLAATLAARRLAPANALLCTGWAAACAALGYQGIARPCLARSPLPEIVARIGAEGSEQKRIGMLGLEDSFGARLRLLSGGTLVPEPLSSTDSFRGELVLASASEREHGDFRELARFDSPGGPSVEILARLFGRAPPADPDPAGGIALLTR